MIEFFKKWIKKILDFLDYDSDHLSSCCGAIVGVEVDYKNNYFPICDKCQKPCTFGVKHDFKNLD